MAKEKFFGVLSVCVVASLLIVSMMFAAGCERTVVDDTEPEPVVVEEDEDVVVADDSEDDPVLIMEVNCKCSDEEEFVCGADKKTYFNACSADCAGVSHMPGECNDETKKYYQCYVSGDCSASYNPVCAKMVNKEDGSYMWETFSNSCTACKAGTYHLDVPGYTRGECGY